MEKIPMKSYDKTLTRLILILTKLSNDERPTIKELAKEFSVGERTLQRDVYERLAYFPIEKVSGGGLRFMEGFSLDRSTLDNEEMMLVYLSLSMVKDNDTKLGSISDRVITKLSTPGYTTPYFMEKQYFEALDYEKEPVKSLAEAIAMSREVTLTLKQQQVRVAPYKIASFDFLWYLFAYDTKTQKIKTYVVRHIKEVAVSQQTFKVPAELDSVLENVHSGFFQDGASFEVVVKVHQEIAETFLARKQNSTQQVLEKDEDGNVLVSFEVSHLEDIDNMVKSWLPHIEVISPLEYREKITNELEEYISSLQHYFEDRRNL